MAINWKKIFRTDKFSLLFGGITLLLVTIGFIYLEVNKSDVKNKNDLYFITDQIDHYRFYKGTRGFRDYTINLKNYSHDFQIIADFIPFFKKSDFENKAYGGKITIGLPKKYYRQREKYVIFSISSDKENYLDYSETIKRHNSIFPKIACCFFAALGFTMLYFGYNYKKTK